MDLVLEIIVRQNFYEQFSNSIKSFCVSQLINSSDTVDGNTEILTCDCIRVYCNILINLIQLNKNVINQIYENYIILDLIRLIPYCLIEQHTSSILMLIDLCHLIGICCSTNDNLLNDIVLQEHAVINALINLLDFSLYGMVYM